jgi:hypothetical protein
MPGIVKVGMTRTKLERRLRELYATGVPVPFECFCAKLMDDPYPVEQAILNAFDPFKMEEREFLRVEPSIIQCVLNLFTGTWYVRDMQYHETMPVAAVTRIEGQVLAGAGGRAKKPRAPRVRAVAPQATVNISTEPVSAPALADGQSA